MEILPFMRSSREKVEEMNKLRTNSVKTLTWTYNAPKRHVFIGIFFPGKREATFRLKTNPRHFSTKSRMLVIQRRTSTAPMFRAAFFFVVFVTGRRRRRKRRHGIPLGPQAGGQMRCRLNVRVWGWGRGIEMRWYARNMENKDSQIDGIYGVGAVKIPTSPE